MAHLQAYDQSGQPMPLADLTGQNVDFSAGVYPQNLTAEVLWLLIDKLVQTGTLTQTDINALLAGVDLAGYSIAVVA